jgi:hypothetical protein
MAEGTYDPVSNRLLLRGGVQLQTCNGMTDMHILTEANGLGGTPNWIPLSPTGGPPPARYSAYLGFDPATNRAILFGGQVACSPTTFNDVWVLTDANGTGATPNWTQLTPTGGPPAGRSSIENGTFYDPTFNQLIVFGGNPGFDDTWVLENANGLGGTPNWVQVSASHPDGDYNAHFGIYDATTNQYIFYGGGDPAGGSTFFDDVWVLSNADGTGGAAVWAENFPTGTSPGGRQRSSGGYRASTNRLFFFGGLDGNLWFSGASSNDLVTNSVFVLKLVPEPSACAMLVAGIGLLGLLYRRRH